MTTLTRALHQLREAVAFLDRVKADKTTDVLITGVSKDAREWLDSAAHDVAKASAAYVGAPVIRFLVHVSSSQVTGGGHRYHWARITSTLSGRSVCIKDTTESYALRLCRDACNLLKLDGYYPEIWVTNAEALPIRQFNASVPKGAVYEPLVTAGLIVELEKPEATEA